MVVYLILSAIIFWLGFVTHVADVHKDGPKGWASAWKCLGFFLGQLYVLYRVLQ